MEDKNRGAAAHLMPHPSLKGFVYPYFKVFFQSQKQYIFPLVGNCEI